MELDDILTGLVIILLMVLVWKWYKDTMSNDSSCDDNSDMMYYQPQQHHQTHPPCQQPPRQPAKSCGGESMTNDYSSYVSSVSLEQGPDGPEASHRRWVEGLDNGVSVGSSSNVILEETGRSYGSSDYVGLTGRKFCKARSLAHPADDARTTASYDVIDEECGSISLTDLI